MLYKIRRAFCYLKELLLLLLCKPLGFLLRTFCPAYQDLWLVAERGNDARDNGYWFYRYLRTEHPELNTRYVITSDSPDTGKIAALGGAVQKGSLQHYLLYYSATYLISTHVQPCSPDLVTYYHLAAKGIRAHGKHICLQHGITKDNLQWMHGEQLYLDLFVCGAKPEYEYIRDTFGFSPRVPQYTGFARFDNLTRAKENGTQKMILVMPTWRGSHYPDGDAFQTTQFYQAFQSLLNSRHLYKILEENNYQLIFYPHIEMQKYLRTFHTNSSHIFLADCTTHDVQQLLMDCSLLITDYSSVFFDVAYLEKPQIYYQFDEEEFRKYHYAKGYFDYRRDGFGPVCTTEEALLQELERAFQSSMQMSPAYKDRVAAFFPLRDTNNCQRIYDAIHSL